MRRLICVFLLAGVSGCIGNGAGDDVLPTASKISIVSGGDQSGTAGEALSRSLVVKVVDNAGADVSGVPVSWAVTTGGGTVSNASTLSAVQGRASVTWTFGRGTGANIATAISGNLAGSPVSFTATAAAGAPSSSHSLVTGSPATIMASSGSSQSTITVTVKDAFGNPVSGATVSGTAYCWGDNSSYQIGDPTSSTCAFDGYLYYDCALSPVALLGGLTFASVSAVTAHTCGVTTAGAAYCWGDNTDGQLGLS